MSRLDESTRRTVRTRADNRCEYCRIHQSHYRITFHVEHIVAKQHLGTDNTDNLAFACHHCNRFKGPNVAGIDEATGELTKLFHPRKDQWALHFSVDKGQIIGLTRVGKTTVQVLNMNAPERTRLRLLLEPEFFA